jgi:hypothetical protein
MGAAARKLLTSDYVNRFCSLSCESPQRLSGRFNPALGDVLYRSNSGASNYAGLGATVRHSSRLLTAQGAYTYSHSIDNQSDALLGDLYSLSLIYPEGAAVGQQPAVFTQQFNSRIDRASSDFDLRHNLVFLSIWNLPQLGTSPWQRQITRGWRAAQFAFIRSGFPYTKYHASVMYAPTGGLLLANRKSIMPGRRPVLDEPFQIPGGVYLLDDDALAEPASGTVGNLGRNSLPGPGFWNMDVSLARNFRFAGLGEAAGLEVRVDAFNVFNHANLTTPVSGFSLRAPIAGHAAFPAVGPLYQTPRRLQLQVRLSF